MRLQNGTENVALNFQANDVGEYIIKVPLLFNINEHAINTKDSLIKLTIV